MSPADLDAEALDMAAPPTEPDDERQPMPAVHSPTCEDTGRLSPTSEDTGLSIDAATTPPPADQRATLPIVEDETSPREDERTDKGSPSNSASTPTATVASNPNSPTGPALVQEVYEMWCMWLNNPEQGNQLEKMLHMLTQGGEAFRSFVQFLARVSEPHRSAGLPPGESNDMIEDEAMWRSCTAMRVACHAFTSLGSGAGDQGVQVLNLVCYELLGGLQPRSRAASMHLCTVMQHLLSAHDLEACSALLHYHAPFVLIRALNKPGCAELLLGLLLGVDIPLPALSANQTLRPITTQSLEQVLQYLRTTGFPNLVAALLDSGAKKAVSCSKPGATSPAPRSPAPRRHWQSPGTPGGRSSGWPSPSGWCTTTPQRLATPKNEASPLSTLLAAPSSPSPSIMPTFMQLPVEPLPQVSSPPPQLAVGHAARSPEPRRLRSPTAPQGGGGIRGRSPSLPGSGGSRSSGSTAGHGSVHASGSGSGSNGTPQQGTPPVAPGTPSSGRGCPVTPVGDRRRPSGIGCVGMSPAYSDQPEHDDQKGLSVLIEFLTLLLDSSGRASELLHKAKHPDKDAETRAEVRVQILHDIFVETSLVPNLFRLFRCGVAQFESAALLHGLLLHVLHPHRRLGPLIEPLLGFYLPHVELLGTLLSRHAPKATGTSTPSGTRGVRPRREIRLNSYTVREPLGALRVSVVQILAVLADLAPDRTLAALKPALWALLVQWFFVYRCNHIFQAACGRLFITVIQHGNVRLQHLLLVKLKLLANLCETVLAEGACGDRWHELRPSNEVRSAQSSTPQTRVLGTVEAARIEKSQVAISQKRHPGGLGGITPVLAALQKVQRGFLDSLEAAAQSQKLGTAAVEGGGPSPAAPRQPLAPRQSVPQATTKGTGDAEEESQAPLKVMASGTVYIARLLGENAQWPQVIGAVVANSQLPRANRCR